MKIGLNFLFATGALAIVLSLSSCGNEEVKEEKQDGVLSAPGSVLKAAQQTVDDANARTEKMEKESRE